MAANRGAAWSAVATVDAMQPRGYRVAAVLAAVVALGGCTADTQSDSPVPHLDAAIERIPQRVADLLEETGVPGLSVAVVHGDEVVYADGFGMANLDSGQPVDADTMFQLASVSKPIGATVIAALVGRGDLRWDDRVVEYLPWFAVSDDWVTDTLRISDLYSHRSGLPDHAGDDLASFGLDQHTVLERLRYLPLHDFRTEYAYTNFGIQAGALAAAAAAGGEWMALSKEVLYHPLGMHRTTSSFAEYTADPNHAVGHRVIDGQWRVTPEQLNDDIATAAGGVASSAADMARWLRLLLAGGSFEGSRVVDAAALAEAMVPQMLMPMHPADPSASRGGYGYGFQVGQLSGTAHTVITHSGAFAQGAGTMVAVVPALDLGVVVLTNGYPVGVAEALTMEIVDWAHHGELTTPWWDMYRTAFAGLSGDFDSTVAGDAPADAAPPGDLERYTGRYHSDYFGDATVTLVNEQLELTIVPAPGASQTWVLEPFDGAVFRVVLDNVDASPESVSAVTFGEDAVTFEFFDHSSGGAGTFDRVD